ncbi:Choline/Carnitine O-acyltransferase [Dictyocaulus viviparus]|uniref:Choline O-acetyltransferase n=1 Tax=Dictyocaulus viviparus TaxID=29172 RepID=A0A0D8XKT8_DICVI|nr:Choline/Carnitine O-acyltransferase [Dictyocaulus viviparus]
MMNYSNQFFFFQLDHRSLLKPPVPLLDHCLDRYIEYAEVVADGQRRSIENTLRAVQDFRKNGHIYQQKLVHIAQNENNWINQFWLPEMYLRVRLPLPVNSSPAYIFPKQHFNDEDEWLRYTALLIRGFVEYKNRVDTKIFYREPGIEEDIQVIKPKRHKENEHILVMCYNQGFVVHTRTSGNLLPFADIIFQLKQVLRMAEARKDVATPIGASGAGDRKTAAQFWSKMQEIEINSISLAWAKEALFVVCLDNDEKKSEQKKNFADRKSQEEDLALQGKYILTGGGCKGHGLNRWYDATIQLVVSSSGTNGLCIEHSPTDGIVIIKMAESALRFERENSKRKLISLADRQICAKPLTWHIDNEALTLLEKQKAALDELTKELDLDVLLFNGFGRNFIKKSGFSPDGFVQLALQLAHFKLHGYLVSTYESASLRRFRCGRVDNIRANTKEALEWVKSMTRNESEETKRILLRRAAEKQALITQENIDGHGIDNHLCALFVLARKALEQGEIEELPGIFVDPMWTELMRFPLSTSQVTTSPDITDCYLCYGAVVRDGYGCSYNLQDDAIIFAPSAFKSNPRTDLVAFKDSIQIALCDMRRLLLS